MHLRGLSVSRKKPLPFPVHVPFAEKLGLELHAFDDGHCEMRVPPDDAHMNGWAVAHGGVVMTMLDITMAFAARTRLPADMAVATIEMKTSFMRPAEGELTATGRVIHKTTTLMFCEGQLHDDHGHLCATATGTFKVLKGLPARGRVATPPPHSPQPKE